MQKNTTKAKLQAGETVFGCFVRYADAGLTEVLGYQGWDFLVFDAEHGTLEPRDCEHLVRAAELRGVTPIIRVTTNQQPTILRFLDTGAQGLHVPLVNSAAEAQNAVQSVKYFPKGRRGLAGMRASEYGQGTPFPEYVKQANAETLVVLQVETRAAIEQLAEIAAVPDVDVIFVGPTDLSTSFGVPGNVQDPRVQEAILHIFETVTRAGKAPGIMVSSVAAARQWQERGARYITIGLDSLLAPAVREYLQAVRYA